MSEKPPSVLIVDDDAVVRVTAQDFLDEGGFTVYEAEDGCSGLAAFERSSPDLVLLDVMMPDMDGYAVCQRLRAMPGGAHVPVLMLTGHDDADSVEQAYACGATDFVSKPVNYPLLVHRLRYLLRAKQTADQLRESEQSLAHAQCIAKLGSWAIDFASGRLRCSAQIRTILFGDAQAPAPTPRRLWRAIHPADRARVKSIHRRALRTGSRYDVEYRLLRQDGTERVVHQETELVLDEAGAPAGLRGTLQDITERRHTEARIRELAYFDAVTGLPNRALFTEHLMHALDTAQRRGSLLAVLFIDLDHFKRVNDSLGHNSGDLLLKLVSCRLTECLRRCDLLGRNAQTPGGPMGYGNTLARLGGDEFVVLLSDLGRAEDASFVARRILDALAEPFTVEETELFVTASIGISSYPGDGADADTLLKSADAAMYRVKSEGRSGFHFYTPETNSRAFQRLSLEAAMRRALEREEFSLHYQPRIDARSERVVGMEALLRWHRPEFGMVAPGEFVPIAEETGLIVPLGEWVVTAACREAQRWREEGLGEPMVSVNLSAVQFRRPGLLDAIADALASAGLAPQRLELELTESILMGDAEESLRVLHAFREMGLEVAIDDFGTGYSSLSYLKRFPIQSLKIDRCFVSDIAIDHADAAIVRGAIQLGHSLGLKVVIEGVETRQQCDRVREYGCDELQGYYYSPPLSPPDLVAWVRGWSAAHALPGNALLTAAVS